MGSNVMPRLMVFHRPPNADATYQTFGFFGSISMSCTRPVTTLVGRLRNVRALRPSAVRLGACAWLAPAAGPPSFQKTATNTAAATITDSRFIIVSLRGFLRAEWASQFSHSGGHG